MPKNKRIRHPKAKRKNNFFLSQVEKAVDKRMLEETPVTAQMCLDAAMIAANEVFNMGSSRCRDFVDAFNAALSEIAVNTIEDGKTDRELWHTKSVLDERLKKICGENFEPWEVRYVKT